MNLERYKKLDEIEHVKKRSGMYLGSISSMDFTGYLVSGNKMTLKNYRFNPALVKMFDELISNSVDEHKRSGSVTEIRVDISPLTNEIRISDNGGIPVEKHPEYKQYIPEMVFGELRAGSNFDDEERIGLGLNGLGAALVAIFSTEFKVETADGKNKFTQVFKNGLTERTKPHIERSKDKGTTITYIPDLKALQCTLDSDNVRRIEKRVYDVAGCNPKIKVWLNGERIKVNSFRDYIKMYTDDFEIDSNENWEVGVAPSTNGFHQISFVNGGDTFNGGTHVDYIANQITAKLREHINNRHKIDVRPANIRQHLMLFINCTINAPTFTSQTKEYMSSNVGDYGTEFEVTDTFIRRIIKGGVVQKVLDWAEAQQRQKEIAELRRLNRQTQNNTFLKRIVKFDDASDRNRQNCKLVLCEGDSASRAILSARDPKTIGVFPLRGKPLNVRDVDVKRLVTNEEFANIMAILGLKIGEKADRNKLRFNSLYIATDFDRDGKHINGLIINMMQQFWPELIEQGFLYRIRTPIVVAKKGKKEYEFFTITEYNKWKNANEKHTHTYYKGLGSWNTKDFRKFLTDPKYLEQFILDDFGMVDLAFDRSRADDRKEWLQDFNLYEGLHNEH